MSSAAQILANRQNAERSHRPVTPEGKTRVSQNATKFGLFSVASFVRPEERNIFNEFETGYLVELAPDSSLEQTLAREIIHAAWRLRRCADLEVAPPENLTDEELDRLQISIDRARAAAQRTFHRSLKELRRLRDERLCATFASGPAPTKPAAETVAQSAQATSEGSRMARPYPRAQPNRLAPSSTRHSSTSDFLDSWLLPSAKQTQSQPEKTPSIPRSAPCPCKSGQKYKRCCGRNAPPVLSRAAA